VIGDVVLIRDFHEERRHWSLGRIIKCYPGNDGLVQVIDVQTNYGVFRRAVTKRGRTNAESHVKIKLRGGCNDVSCK
jgi:hypothetical protein